MKHQEFSALLGDLCTFTCMWCTFESNIYFLLFQHIREKHSSRISLDLLPGDAESYCSTRKITKCKICKECLLHDSYSLSLHLKTKHKRSSDSIWNQIYNYVALKAIRKKKSGTFNAKYLQSCFVRVRLSKYVQYLKDNSIRDSVPCVVKKDLVGTGTLRNFGFNGSKLLVKPTTEIGDLCVFQCQKCRTIFRSLGILTIHLSQECFPKYKKNGIARLVKSCLIEARYHQCRWCGHISFCDIKVIEKHVRNYHRKNLFQYMFKATINGLRSKLLLISHYNFKGPVLSERERREVPTESITREAENLCTFQCDKCFTECSSLLFLKSHLVKCKGTGKFQPDYVSSAAIHECKVCCIRMLCDREVILRHLAQVHSMPIKTYVDIPTNNIQLITDKLIKRNKLSNNQISSDNILSVPLVLPLNRIKNDKSSLPNISTTNKVGNYCVYSCDTCDFKTDSWGGMKNHNVNSDHGPGHSKYDKKYVTEARYHRCTICLRVMLCDISVIKPHVRLSHGYTLKKYSEISNKLEEKNDLPNEILENIGQKSSPSQPQEDDVSRVLNTNEATKSNTTKEYANLLTLRCDKCKTVLRSWKRMQNHLKKCKNNSTINDKIIMQTIWHECKICKKKILCDKSLIMKHLYNVHEMGVKTYGKLGKNDAFFNPEFRTVQDGDSLSLSKSVKVFSYSLSKNHSDFTVPKGLINDSDMTSSISNYCTFKCIYCGLKTSSWPGMTLHVNSAHKSDKTRVVFHTDFVHECIYHKCYICFKGILCDEDIITRHARKEHNIFLLEKYKKWHVKNLNSDKQGDNLMSTKVQYEKSYRNLPTHVSEDMVSKVSGNECLFSCDKCKKTFKTWCDFRFHKRKVHEDFRFMFETGFVKKAKYYSCPICKLFILCDRYMLRNHLSCHNFRSLKKFDTWLKESISKEGNDNIN